LVSIRRMKKLLTRTIGASLNTLAHIAPKRTARLGFELFCRPMRLQINAKQKAFFHTAKLDVVMHKGNAIQTYQWGNGEKKILLLHGWQSHTYRWKSYIEVLKDEYSVFSIDAPGHGLSGGKLLNVPLYSEVIEEQIARIGTLDAIITHSLGAFSTLYTAYRKPDLPVNKIITLASPGEAQEFFNFFMNTLNLSNKTTKLVTDHFKETFQKTPDYFSAPAFASAVKIPGLIIHDEGDPETPFYHAERIHHAWKNSRLIKTKGYGHNLRAPEVLHDVVKFVKDSILVDANSQ
jgi:pimeloyl-ACP methyl ester carboxylesterase